jgi:hypothetical protein
VQRITVNGVSVGVAGLEDIFRNWLAAGKKAADLTKDQVVQSIQGHNYIPPRLEDKYAEAIRAKYAAYCEKSPERATSC